MLNKLQEDLQFHTFWNYIYTETVLLTRINCEKTTYMYM